MIQGHFVSVPLAEPDPILHLNTLFKQDSDPSKISVGVGAYRDDQGKPVVLPIVKKAAAELSADHEYLPIDGLSGFSNAAAKMILGDHSPVISEKRVFLFHSCISMCLLNHCLEQVLFVWLRKF